MGDIVAHTIKVINTDRVRRVSSLPFEEVIGMKALSQQMGRCAFEVFYQIGNSERRGQSHQ